MAVWSIFTSRILLLFNAGHQPSTRLRKDWNRAVDDWRRCTTTGKWSTASLQHQFAACSFLAVSLGRVFGTTFFSKKGVLDSPGGLWATDEFLYCHSPDDENEQKRHKKIGLQHHDFLGAPRHWFLFYCSGFGLRAMADVMASNVQSTSGEVTEAQQGTRGNCRGCDHAGFFDPVEYARSGD